MFAGQHDELGAVGDASAEIPRLTGDRDRAGPGLAVARSANDIVGSFDDFFGIVGAFHVVARIIVCAVIVDRFA